MILRLESAASAIDARYTPAPSPDPDAIAIRPVAEPSGRPLIDAGVEANATGRSSPSSSRDVGIATAYVVLPDPVDSSRIDVSAAWPHRIAGPLGKLLKADEG